MPSNKIIDYIKSSREKGLSDEQIKSSLQEAGWQEKAINEAFAKVDSKDQQPSEIELESNNIKKFILPTAIAVGLLLIGGIIYGFFLSGETSLLDDEENLSPREEIMQGYENLMKLDSVAAKIGVDVEAEAEQTKQSVDVQASITQRISDLKEEMEVILEGEGMANGTGGTFKGEIFVVNDKLFGKVSEFPSAANMFLPIDVSAIKGENILLTEDLSEKVENADLEKQASKTPFQEQLSNELDVEVDKETAEKMANDFVKGVWDKKILTIQETSTDKVKEKELNKHSIELNLEKLPQLIFEIAEKYEDEVEDLDAEKVESNFEENREDFDKLKEDLKKVSLDIFIWTDDKYIHKVEISIKDAGKQSEMYSKFDFKTSLGFSEFNKSLNLEEPEEYTHIDELMSELESSTDSSVDTNGQTNEDISDSARSAYDTQIKSELSRVKSSAEQYYYGNDASYSGYASSNEWADIAMELPSCSQSYLNDNNISKASSDHKDINDSSNVYQISVKDQSYATWAPLCLGSSDSSIVYYCVDSDGNAGEYNGFNSVATKCEDVFSAEGNSNDQENKTKANSDIVNDTHIKSHLSQIRSNAEQYYYDNEGEYAGYDDSESWKEKAEKLLSCSKELHEKAELDNPDEYQINIKKQSYAAWGALCQASSEENIHYYCVDSDGNDSEYSSNIANSEATNCKEIFGN